MTSTQFPIPDILDDARLSPYAFRVYCHLARQRHDLKKDPSATEIAKACGLSVQTVRKSLKELGEANIVASLTCKGRPAVHIPTPPNTWRIPPR